MEEVFYVVAMVTELPFSNLKLCSNSRIRMNGIKSQCDTYCSRSHSGEVVPNPTVSELTNQNAGMGNSWKLAAG